MLTLTLALTLTLTPTLTNPTLNPNPNQVGDEGTILQTDDRGETWREITNDVISSLGTNSLKNGKRLTEVRLRAVTPSQP